MQQCFELAVHVYGMAVFNGDDGHCSPMKKTEMSTRDAFLVEGEKTSVTLAGDASCVVCVNFTR